MYEADRSIKENKDKWEKLPPTVAQRDSLIWRGHWREGMTRGEANDLLGRLKAAEDVEVLNIAPHRMVTKKLGESGDGSSKSPGGLPARTEPKSAFTQSSPGPPGPSKGIAIPPTNFDIATLRELANRVGGVDQLIYWLEILPDFR
jgi:hypothetical protein